MTTTTTTNSKLDPGNGKVLYKQALPSSLSTAGHAGMFGKDMTGPFFGGHGEDIAVMV